MDWIVKMNEAIDYIESNLDKTIDYDYLGKLANCSAYHFQKVFSYLANTTLSEYIRRRRLTLAAFDLQHTDEKIIDIAMKYNYDSPTSFTRAFYSLHQMSPSEARQKNKTFVAYPPLSFQISIKGVVALNYYIEEQEEIRFKGVKITLDMSDEKNLEQIPQFWQEVTSKGIIDQLCTINDGKIKGVAGITEPVDASHVNYWIAISSGSDDGSFEELILPAGKWAIFKNKGALPEAMQELHKRIFAEWLPTSGYEFTNTPDIELYPEGDLTSKDYESEIWLPIK